jgi:putative peptidoglycan lipid II flippase
MKQLVARFVPRGSLVLAALTLGSYVLGLLRDRIFAQSFGAGTALDSYNAAFLIPDFAFNLLVASGIAAAVVPIFTRLRRENEREAYLYVSSIMTFAVVVMLASGLFIVVAAPWLSRLIAPGLGAEEQALVARLMRIVAFSPILFAASNALGAMLVAQKRFLFYGLSPLLYNVGIIAGALWLTPRLGVAGIAYGTLLGATAHLTIRLIDALRSGWPLYPLFKLPIPQLSPTLKLMIPKMIGHPVELVTFGVFTSLASLLSAGSITVLNFARNFQSVPVSVIGIAMATAVFPALAEASLASTAAVRQLLRRTAASIFLASGTAALLMFIIRRPLIQLLLGGGAFTAEAVERTALVLGVFCLAIPTESLSHLFARAFYATHNTVVPVVLSVVSLAVSAGSAYVLSQSLGIVGLPLGFFLGSLVKTLGLYAAFQYRLTRQ